MTPCFNEQAGFPEFHRRIREVYCSVVGDSYEVLLVTDGSRDPTRPVICAQWWLYNVGNSRPVEVIDLVRLIELAVGRAAIREFLPIQPGDALETFADSST